MTTKVCNLATGDYIIFTLPPREAVVNAWYQAQGNWNTWEYDYDKAPVEQTRRFVVCGDFCAPLEGKDG